MSICYRKSITAAAAFAAASLFLTSCSDAPKPVAEVPKEAAKPAEAGPAKAAFWKMYKPIREWAKDAQVLSVTNTEIPELKGGEGKSGAWTAVFVSPSLKQSRTVTYGEVDSKDVHKGVSVESSAVWTGATREVQPFPTADFGTDSDAAYAAAAKKAEKWLKEHPGEKVNMLLGKAAQYATPVWVVSWGDKKSGFLAVINAVNGEVISPK